MWGLRETDRRGRKIEEFITRHDLNMNNGAPTRIWCETESAIDLSMCLPQLDAEMHWSVLNSPGDSDHCPIITKYNENEEDYNIAGYWNVKKAIWDLYQSSDAWRNLPGHVEEVDNAELIGDLYNRITAAATEAIRQTQYTQYYSKSWWSEELKQSKRRRQVFYQEYRRNKTMVNFILWRRNRAQHKLLVKKYKRKLEEICRNTQSNHRR